MRLVPRKTQLKVYRTRSNGDTSAHVWISTLQYDGLVILEAQLRAPSILYCEGVRRGFERVLNWTPSIHPPAREAKPSRQSVNLYSWSRQNLQPEQFPGSRALFNQVTQCNRKPPALVTQCSSNRKPFPILLPRRLQNIQRTNVQPSERFAPFGITGTRLRLPWNPSNNTEILHPLKNIYTPPH